MGFVDTDGDGVVRGKDLTAWVEVQDAERGWVAVDPEPEPRPVKERSTTKEHAVALPRSVLPPDRPVQREATPPRADESERPQAPQPPAWRVVLAAVWWWTWRGGLGLAVLSAPLWLVVLAEAWRRRVRRRSDLRRREVVGAWDELRDEVLDAGTDVPRHATRSELAAGERTLTTLAAAADRIGFSPEPVTRDDVLAYWEDAAAARRELRGRGSRRERWRRRYSWRSIGAWLRTAWRADA